MPGKIKGASGQISSWFVILSVLFVLVLRVLSDLFTKETRRNTEIGLGLRCSDRHRGEFVEEGFT